MGIGRFTIHEDQLEEFRRSVMQAVKVARRLDTGTLQYEIFVNGDESECIVIERYRESDALMEHGAHVGELIA